MDEGSLCNKGLILNTLFYNIVNFCCVDLKVHTVISKVMK